MDGSRMERVGWAPRHAVLSLPVQAPKPQGYSPPALASVGHLCLQQPHSQVKLPPHAL